jgi:outer membrane protein OmpA-like peptidoglycan-associated protein
MTEGHLLRIWNVSLLLGGVVAIAGLTSGCAGTKVFEGQTALAVVGTPPPPPPAKKEPPRVEVTDKKIEIHEKIQFDYNTATIKPASFSLMDEITDVIKKHPEIQKTQVEGYASAEGDDFYNQQLSDRRAKSVMKYLVDHGVDASRLVAKGFGEDRPIASNDTEEGREKNRRVEFNILERSAESKVSSAVGSAGAGGDETHPATKSLGKPGATQ